MADGFNVKEFTAFEKKLLKLANDKMPKESKKFMREEGTKLRRITLAKAKQKVKKDTGNYFESIKRGKVYKYNGTWAIRDYSYAPHSHLIEHGHRIIRDGKEVGFVKGKHVFEEASKEFEGKYFDDSQKFIDNVLDKGL